MTDPIDVTQLKRQNAMLLRALLRAHSEIAALKTETSSPATSDGTNQTEDMSGHLDAVVDENAATQTLGSTHADVGVISKITGRGKGVTP